MKERKNEENAETGAVQVAQAAFCRKLLALAAMISVAKSQEVDEEEGSTSEFNVMMGAFAILTILAQVAWKVGGSEYEQAEASLRSRGRKVSRAQQGVEADLAMTGRAGRQIAWSSSRQRSRTRWEGPSG